MRLTPRVRAAGFLGVLRLGSIPLGLLAQGLAARLLGLDDFGRYAVSLSLFNALGVLTGFGLADGITREVAATRSGAVRLAVTASLMPAVPVAALWLVVGPSIHRLIGAPSALPFVALVSLGGLSRAGLRLTGSVARGASRLTLATMTEVGALSLVMAIVLGVVWGLGINVSLLQVFAIQVAAVLSVMVIATAVLVFTQPTPLLGTHTPKDAVALARRSLPLLGSQTSLMISSTIALWVVSATLEPADVARYTIAARIAALATIPGVVIQFMAAPDLASGWRDGMLVERTRWLRNGVSLAFVASALYVAGSIIAWEVMVRAFFDLELANVLIPLAILGLAQLVQVGTGPCGNALIMAGFERTTFRATFVGAIMVVLVIVPLVNTFGVAGAATATAAGIVVVNLLNARGARDRMNLTTWVDAPHLRSRLIPRQS